MEPDTYYVMICVGMADGRKGPAGQYLKNYQPEAYAGRGSADWTFDPLKAMHFTSSTELLRFWRTVPKNRPVRDDGQPNRPLTAFTVISQMMKG